MTVDVYCITYDDETDVLPNAVSSVRPFADRIWLFDGGPTGHLCQNPRPDVMTIREFASFYNCEYTYHAWLGTPGAQRNWAVRYLAEHSMADWIFQVDSDEVVTYELRAMMAQLKAMPTKVTQITFNQITLYPDERHCVNRGTAPLTHSRLLRRGHGRWTETWHEHLFIGGERLYWPAAQVHLRVLFHNRLIRQRGHGIERMWDDYAIVPVPLGVTWPPIIYPDEDQPCHS